MEHCQSTHPPWEKTSLLDPFVGLWALRSLECWQSIYSFPFFFFVISSCQPRNSPSIKNACFHFPSFIYGSKYGSSLFFRWLNCGIKRFHGQVLSEIYGEALIPKWLYFCFRTLCREGHTPSLFSVVTSVELKFGCGKMPRASLIAQLIKNPPAMQETLVLFLGREDPLEKE